MPIWSKANPDNYRVGKSRGSCLGAGQACGRAEYGTAGRSKAEKLSGTKSDSVTKTVGKEKHIGLELRAVGCFDGLCVCRSWWVWGYFT